MIVGSIVMPPQVAHSSYFPFAYDWYKKDDSENSERRLDSGDK